jgi:hypothetical protein
LNPSDAISVTVEGIIASPSHVVPLETTFEVMVKVPPSLHVTVAATAGLIPIPNIAMAVLITNVRNLRINFSIHSFEVTKRLKPD